MAIFVPCSRLSNKELAWVPCDPDMTQQTFAGEIVVGESSFFARCNSQRYAEDVVAVTLD